MLRLQDLLSVLSKIANIGLLSEITAFSMHIFAYCLEVFALNGYFMGNSRNN